MKGINYIQITVTFINDITLFLIPNLSLIKHVLIQVFRVVPEDRDLDFIKSLEESRGAYSHICDHYLKQSFSMTCLYPSLSERFTHSVMACKEVSLFCSHFRYLLVSINWKFVLCSNYRFSTNTISYHT